MNRRHLLAALLGLTAAAIMTRAEAAPLQSTVAAAAAPETELLTPVRRGGRGRGWGRGRGRRVGWRRGRGRAWGRRRRFGW